MSHTCESSRGERRSWLKDRIQAITCMEIQLQDDIDNDSSLDWARAKGRHIPEGGRATNETKPGRISKQKPPQPKIGGVRKRTTTKVNTPKKSTDFLEAVSDELGASAPGIFQRRPQAAGPSNSATLPGQNTHQPTHATPGNEPRDLISQDPLSLPAHLATGPVTTHPDFLFQLDPTLVGDMNQPDLHAPTIFPRNNSGKPPERPSIMQSPSSPERLEQWMFGGPVNEILCSTMLDPACPTTLIPPGILNGFGYDYTSKMMHNGIFLIPNGPVTVGPYTVTHYVMNLCVLPSGDHDPIWFDAYVLPLPNNPHDRSTWTQRQHQDYNSAWCQDHIIMGTTLHGMLADCPRQSITAHPGNN